MFWTVHSKEHHLGSLLEPKKDVEMVHAMVTLLEPLLNVHESKSNCSCSAKTKRLQARRYMTYMD